jgi:transcription initiation factor IIE alpha subunit
MRHDEPLRFRNFYTCPDDGTRWHDEWSCQCNDRCPTCNKEITPSYSEDLAKAGGNEA